MNFKVHQTCTGTKKKTKNKNFTIYLGRGDYPSKVFVFFAFFVPVQVWCTLKFKTFVFFVPVQVWCTLKFKTLIFLVPVHILDRVLDFKVHQTCTGTKKNTSFELQTAQNLHRDQKKTKVLNFKVHQTCTGTRKQKKNKNFRGIVAPSQVDCEVFVFFVPAQVWCTLKFKTLIFLVPVHILDRVLDFKVHQTCTGTKKTKVLNFKVHQTCTGTKKQKKKQKL